ncbi:MAG: aminotransferase class I/II-fold pyridoxal phosphate-dependent enzyme [Patescibacteria group bacterium]
MHNYLHVPPPKRTIDCCYTSNFDEEYGKIFPFLSPAAAVELVARYPDFSYRSIREGIRRRFRVSSVALGSGSEDIILRLNAWLRDRRVRVAMVEPIFHRTSESFRGRYVRLNQDSLFTKNLGQFGAVWLQNPNLFTGDAYRTDRLRRLIRRYVRVLFLIDEAAIFTVAGWQRYSLLPFLRYHPNVVAVESLSKMYGLCGLRAGFAAGNNVAVAALRERETTFPFTSLTVAYVAAVLRSGTEQFLNHLRRRIRQHQAELCRVAERFPGTKVWCSVANCIFLRSLAGQNVHRALTRAGVLTFDVSDGRGDTVRITVHSSRRIQYEVRRRLSRALSSLV